MNSNVSSELINFMAHSGITLTHHLLSNWYGALQFYQNCVSSLMWQTYGNHNLIYCVRFVDTCLIPVMHTHKFTVVTLGSLVYALWVYLVPCRCCLKMDLQRHTTSDNAMYLMVYAYKLCC